MMEKIICPECGSSDYEVNWLNEDYFECEECGATFPIVLEECECGSNFFTLLPNGLYVCDECNNVYDEQGHEIFLFCQECGCMKFDFIGDEHNFEAGFRCIDCGSEYDFDDPELYM